MIQYPLQSSLIVLTTPSASQVQMSISVSCIHTRLIIDELNRKHNVYWGVSFTFRPANPVGSADRSKCRPGPQDHACRFNSTLPDLFTLLVNILSHCFGEHIISGLTSKHSFNWFCIFCKYFDIIIEYGL